jgi:hypothetical protein
MLLRQRRAALHPRGIAGVGRRRGFGNLAMKSEKVADRRRSALRHLVHRLEGAQLLAKHEELDQRVGACCAPSDGVFSVSDWPFSP